MQFLTHRKILTVLIVAMPLAPLRGYAQEQNHLQLSSQKIEAGLIYNFLKYTAWPREKLPGPSSPLAVCIFGTEDPFSGFLQPIEEGTFHQRAVKLRFISSVAESDKCHMIFIGADEKAQWPALRKFLANKSVMTVGGFDGFSRAGGMIEFSSEDNRIQIWLNVQAVSEAKLHIYDSLRRLAKVTHPSSTREPE